MNLQKNITNIGFKFIVYHYQTKRKLKI